MFFEPEGMEAGDVIKWIRMTDIQDGGFKGKVPHDASADVLRDVQARLKTACEDAHVDPRRFAELPTEKRMGIYFLALKLCYGTDYEDEYFHLISPEERAAAHQQNVGEPEVVNFGDGSGVVLIVQERASQIRKGYTPEADNESNAEAELLQAAQALIYLAMQWTLPATVSWPWDEDSLDLSLAANPVECIAKAGAFLAAEIDRINYEDSQ